MMLQEYSLKVGPQDLQVLVGALHEGPYKIVAPVLNKLQAQITEQEMAAQQSSTLEKPEGAEG